MSKLGVRPTIGPGPGQMSHCTEIYDECPYNPSHIILRYRMQTHLHKCRQNYPLDDKVICQFNATHHIPQKELQYHYDHCPSREDFMKSLCQFEADKPVVKPVEISLPAPEENWDDGAVGGYDPKAAAQKKNLIRGIHGCPPSERKDFKLKHRRHLQDLEAEAAEMGPVKSRDVVVPPCPVAVDEPLRMPKEPPPLLRLGRGAGFSVSVDREAPKAIPEPVLSSETAKTPNPSWRGIGRGRGSGPAPFASAPLPSSNPWGRGRPKF